MAAAPLLIWAIQALFIGGSAWIANTLITGNDKVENIITVVAVGVLGLLLIFAIGMSVAISKENSRSSTFGRF
jgi:apolipoprotein N-acyltransferase